MDTRVDRETDTPKPIGLATPVQAQPVDRAAAIAAAVDGQTPGVEASAWQDWAKSIGGTLLSFL
jgi:hypothetical protein